MGHDTQIGFYFGCGRVLNGVMRHSFAFLRLFGDCLENGLKGTGMEGGKAVGFNLLVEVRDDGGLFFRLVGIEIEIGKFKI